MLFALLVLSVTSQCLGIRVQAPIGTFIGYNSTTVTGVSYYSFSGVRYSKPMTAENRFREADMAEPSNEIFNATQEGPKCIQYGALTMSNTIEGQEDCLFLNIYTPTIKGKIPVLVTIPPGFFYFSSASREVIGPDYFMEKGRVMVVSVNHRLGIFGFADFKSPEFPANLGLRDQVLALKWIQKYISYFGGDPDKVTIHGLSAGAASVHFHLLSPLSKGLFHAAISESGSAFSTWALRSDYGSWKHLKSAVRKSPCKKYLSSTWRESNSRLAYCLRNQTAESIIQALISFNPEDPIILFAPVVEYGRIGAFLPNDPWSESSESDPNIPWLSGVNSDEMGFYLSLIAGPGLIRKYLVKHYCKDLYFIWDTAADPQLIVMKIRKHFLNGSLSINKTTSEIEALKYGTNYLLFYYPNFNILQRHKGIKYSYVFGYKEKISVVHKYNLEEGVPHVGEFTFLFSGKEKDIWKTGFPEEIDMSRIMVDLWTNFIIQQNPTPNEWISKGGKFIPTWNPWTAEDNQIYFIGQSEIKMSVDPFLKEYPFWSQLPFHNKQFSAPVLPLRDPK